MMRTLAALLVPALLLLPAPGAGAGEPSSVHDRAVASLKAMFGDSVVVSQMAVRLTPEEQRVINESSQTRWAHDTIAVYRCSAPGGQPVGYGFLDDVKGKMQMITMLTGLEPGGEVRDVDILVYRESYGGEVGNESFRRQFRGRDAASDIRPGSAIRNISGATISARAVTFGVRKACATYQALKERLTP